MTHGAPKIAVEKELKCKSCKFNSGLVTTEQNFNIINPSYIAISAAGMMLYITEV